MTNTSHTVLNPITTASAQVWVDGTDVDQTLALRQTVDHPMDSPSVTHSRKRSFHVVCMPEGDCMIDAETDESWDAEPGEVAAWAAAYNIPIFYAEDARAKAIFYFALETENAQIAFKLRWDGEGDGAGSS